MTPSVRMARAAAVACALAPLSASADSCRLLLAIGDDFAHARGHLECRLVTQGRSRAFVWLYPNALATPAGLTPINHEFYYPGAFEPGGMRLAHTTVNGSAVEPAPADVPGAPPGAAVSIPLAGEESTFATDFAVDVPARYGPFGHAAGQLDLLAPVHPYVTLDAAERMPRLVDWSVVLSAPRGCETLLAGRGWAGGEVLVRARPFVELVVRRGRFERVGPPDAPMFARPRADGEGWDPLAAPEAPDQADERNPGDVQRRVEAAMKWLRKLVPDAKAPTLVEAPLRNVMAIATPDTVAVSDRAFRVFPLRLLERLHEQAIVRRVFSSALLARAFAHEGPERAWRVADIVGAALAERYTQQKYGVTMDVQETLGPLENFAQVEEFLRSPKAAFADVYFRSPWDPVALRDELPLWNNGYPRGRVAAEKVGAVVGRQAVFDAVDGWLACAQCTFEDTLVAARGPVSPDRVRALYRDWLEVMPEVAYGVAGFEARPTADGKHRATARIAVTGALPADTLEVHFKEGRRTCADVTIDAGGQGTLEASAVCDARPTSLDIDPHHRLVERSPEAGVRDLAADNRFPPGWLPVLTHFEPTWSAADARFGLATGMFVRPRDDARWKGIGEFEFGPAVANLTLGVRRYFGPVIEPMRLASSFGGGVEVLRLREGFGGAGGCTSWAPRDGCVATGGYLSWAWDDRAFVFDPRAGSAAVVSTSLLASAVGATFTAQARATHVFGLAEGHTLAVRARLGTIAGPAPRQLLFRLGGIEDVRGFQSDEVLARTRAIGSAEWRHTFVRDLDVDAFALYRIRKVGGALFGDVAFADRIESAGYPERALLGGAGYGLRVFADFFGIRRAVLSIDLATPLGRRVPGRRTPISTYVYFVQSFTSP